ncbi:hypothetical protein [Enterocloster hominis (ex Hitch et al. 2024)]|uniref:Uncharacterized protein n=1 Tax=Enterocloster hominis (ex Hitch et al. 2024) TaxID=1917870 RepID=A0ABV1DGQ9_9FIRM
MRKKTVKGAREIRETIERIEPMEQSRPANALERKNNLIKYKKNIVAAGKKKYKNIKGGGSWKEKLGKDMNVSDSTITYLLRPKSPCRKNGEHIVNLEKQLGLPEGLLTRVRYNWLGGNWEYDECNEYNDECDEDRYWAEKKIYYTKLRNFFKKNDLQSCILLIKEMPVYLKLPIEIQKNILEYKDKITLCNDDAEVEEKKYLECQERDKYYKSRLQLKLKLTIKAIEKFYPINYDADTLEKFFEFIIVDKKSVLPLYLFFEEIRSKNAYDKELLRKLTKYSL